MAYRRAFPGAVRATRGVVASGGVSGFNFDANFSGSGTASDGASFTFNDALNRLGTKPGGGKPRRWYPYESSLAVDSTYSRDTSSLGTQTGCTFQTTVKPTNGAGSAKQTNFSGDTYLFTSSPPFDFSSTGKCMVFVERLHDHTNNGDGSTTVIGGGSNNLNLKTFRAWSVGGSAAGLPDGYVAVGSDLRASFMEQTSDEIFSTPAWCQIVFGANGISQGTSFVSCEHYVKPSSSGGANDGTWAHVRNGLWNSDITDTWITHSGGTTLGSCYLDELTVNASAGNPGGNIYYHALYFDDSWCHVMVSDESSYSVAGSGTQHTRAICIPTSWAAGSVTCVIRQGQWGALSGKYLWVVTENHTRIRVGQFT